MVKDQIDTLLIEQTQHPPRIERFKIETPLGSLESDSGSHLVDVMTIICVVAVLYVGRKMIDKYFKKD
jgi:hypothetical protein